MLRHLRLHQVVLVEEADIPFGEGLHVLSGETGSGKSAVIGALRLVLGSKADPQLIRRGADRALVEAVFDIDEQQAVRRILSEAGIEQAEDEDLIIRRELRTEGKSRTFVNNRLASTSLLKEIAPYLADVVTQHANTKLLSLDFHRHCLDAFAETEPQLNAFQKAWATERELRAQLEALALEEAARLREIEVCRMELEELHAGNLVDGEEEELFAEFGRLANADNLQRLVGGIDQTLSGGRNAVLMHLMREKGNLDQLVEIDSSMSSVQESYASVLLELEEIGHSLRNYYASIHHDPIRLSTVDERLSLLNRLKRKYGATIEDVIQYMQNRESQLSELENADSQMEELQKDLIEAEKLTQEAAVALSKKRKAGASKLASAVTAEIRALNMPAAELKVSVSSVERTTLGEDRVELSLAPNVGERFVSLREGISGGEIARVMLALKRVLAGRESISTLVFDEVDANIGGETATIIGETLKEISRQHQVICITHFPQVARCADHHLQISKREKGGRTQTEICLLPESEREEELQRMLGGAVLN